MASKRITDLPASATIADSDKIEIESGLAGKHATFLTVWNWIKTKISNWTTVLQYLGEASGKLTYKGTPVVAVNGIDKELMFNDATAQSTVSGMSWDKTLKVLGLLLATKVKRYLITTPAALFTGTATTGGTTTVINVSFNATGLAGKALLFTGGLNKSQCRKIVTSTATSVTVSPAFPNAPTNGDTVEAIETTTILSENLGGVYGFAVTNHHAVVLPQITAAFDGAWSIYFVKSITTGKQLHILTNPTDTVDGISTDVLLLEARETVTHFASFADSRWITLATENLAAVATIAASAQIDITTNTTAPQAINGNPTAISLLRFSQVAGETYKLEYNSTVPRRMLFGTNINITGITNQIQIATVRVMKFTKATGVTAEVVTSRRSVTLSATGDTQQIIITANERFDLGDRIWLETYNDVAGRQYRILTYTMDVR